MCRYTTRAFPGNKKRGANGDEVDALTTKAASDYLKVLFGQQNADLMTLKLQDAFRPSAAKEAYMHGSVRDGFLHCLGFPWNMLTPSHIAFAGLVWPRLRLLAGGMACHQPAQRS